MMKTAVLVVLVSCAVCGDRDVPCIDGSVAMAVGALTEKVSQLETKLQTMGEEFAALKSITQGTPKVAFSAALGKGDTGPFDVDTPLKYKTVFSNFGNNYSRATGIFTATVKGVYFFGFSMQSTHKANSVVSLMKNEGRVVTVWDDDISDSNDTGSNAAVLPLEVGDTVYVQLKAKREVYDDASNYNTFSGFLLFN